MRHTSNLAVRLGIALLITTVLGCGGEEESASNPAPKAVPEATAGTSPKESLNTAIRARSDANSGQATTPVTLTTGGPRFVLLDPVIDYGDIHDFEKRASNVAFVNGGDATLTVKQVQPTCGCTTVKLQTTVFAPGEGDEITLNFSPKGKGPQTKYVKIHTNDPNQPITNLAIKANVLGTMNASPRTFRLGTIPLGKPYKTSSIISAEDPRYVPTSVSLLGDIAEHGTASLTEITPEGAALRSWRVDLELPATLPWGWHTGSANIRGTVNTEERIYPHRFSMGLNLTVEGELLSSDTMFRLLLLTPGQRISKTVTISRVGNAPFEIHSAKVVGNGADYLKVDAVPTNTERNQWVLTMSGTAPDLTMVMQGDVELSTNVPGEDLISIRYMGNIRKSR
ncbi:MAG: DUF1573 domain-containing protein [Phycisphaerales bacterium]|nr:DUF1573 domain-containing protein [Phycisphaerales bacterium]